MRYMSYALPFFLFTLLLLSCNPSKTDNTEKIIGKWIFEKAETVRPSDSLNSLQDLLSNTIMEFDGKEMQLSRRDFSSVVALNKGPYQLKGSTLTLGKDPVEILELTDQKLVCKSPQAVLHYRKL